MASAWESRRSHSTILDHVLLGSGIAAALTYAAADLACGLSYPGYSFTDQVISELSAIGAPTAAMWMAFMPVFGILFAAFATGVVRASRDSERLRLTGWLLAVFVLTGPLWSFFPMHMRGDAFTASDVGHITLGVMSVPLMCAVVFSASRAFGARFRVFSLASLCVILPAGAASFLYIGRMIREQATPAVGSLERLSVHGFFIWSAVLAVAVIRERSSSVSAGRGQLTR